MIELQKSQAKIVEPFFHWTEETLILSFIQGYMGRGWVDDLEKPSCAMVIAGDYCIIAGNSGAPAAMELVRGVPSKHFIFVPQDEGWCKLLEAAYGEKANRHMRYAFTKEQDIFDYNKLQEIKDSLPEGFEIRLIDGELYHKAMSGEFSRDLCGNFASEADFLARGLGCAVLRNGELVCGASSYSAFDGGIEVEIDTKNEYRRRGLAASCAAALILECKKRGLFPSWDAANLASKGLAEKLGYRFSHEYASYWVER
jgi:GNAT superfamily N-acetyltransferase